MVFGLQQQQVLKNEIEGLREEKDFFRSKYLEQVSEIAALRESLEQSHKEIQRLRQELMTEAGVDGATVKLKTPSPGNKKKKSKKKKIQKSPPSCRPKHKEEEKKDDYLHDGAAGEHDETTTTGHVDHDAETISNLSADEEDDDQSLHRVDPDNDDEQESEDDDDDSSENDDDEEEEEAEAVEDEDEQAAIRRKAEQLVLWASYRRDKLSPSSSLSNKS